MQPTFFDSESEALYVNCSLVQLRHNQINHIININNDQEQEECRKHLETLYLVGYNLSYDIGLLNLEPLKIEDLFYASKIAFPLLREFTLDIVAKHCGFSGYDSIDKSGMQKAGFIRGAYLSARQKAYAIADVEALEVIYNHPSIQKVISTNVAYRLGVIALMESAIWQKNGIPLLPERVKYYTDKLNADLPALEATLNGMNPRSPKQVKEYFNGVSATDKATLTRIVINGKIEESVKSRSGRGINNKAMVFTEEQQRMAETVLAARGMKNALSKLAQYHYPKLYGRFNPMGASTSRFTCKGGDHPQYFNAQNYPRQFKSCFGVTEDSGLIIIAADYATLEIRLAASIMKEPNMYAALMRGEDIHKTTASLIYDKDISEVDGRERSNSKVANFGLTYGMGSNTFIQYAFDLYGIKFSEDEAKMLISKFFTAYPGLKTYHNMVGREMRSGSYICQTALGYKMAPKIYADAINGPTQGTGGECMRLAIHKLATLDARALKMIVNSIHDALYLIVPQDEEAYWSDLLGKAMVMSWLEIMKSPLLQYHDIPMPVEIMRGWSMGDLEKGFAGGGQALSVAEMRETQARNKK
jgi:DNA polymerase-1